MNTVINAALMSCATMKTTPFQYLPVADLPQPRHDEAQDRRQDGISHRVLLRGRVFPSTMYMLGTPSRFGVGAPP